MWCPTRGVSIWPSETRHAQHEKCGWLKEGRKGARYARIAAGDLRPCPPPFSQPLCSAMSSMHRCCSSELKRRSKSNLVFDFLPWVVFSGGGFSTCCISRLPPKWWPGVQQGVELVCDTPHMVYLGQCKHFCNEWPDPRGRTGRSCRVAKK